MHNRDDGMDCTLAKFIDNRNLGEEEDIVEDTKVSEEGGVGGALDTIADTLLQPMVKTTVTQIVPLQPMEVNSGANVHLQPVEYPMLE
ncbi:hypothetical protein llap_3618 [Limosa lapponica baueri]|uniref:Uncharacterized protein n=1 Tax=Limosa lapponica baueri TaxID=1758121 RepID=A0A2I0UJ23_LIMLA|nr:hypothetical protein llap_3618 [Limosa lapponica baueri]